MLFPLMYDKNYNLLVFIQDVRFCQRSARKR